VNRHVLHRINRPQFDVGVAACEVCRRVGSSVSSMIDLDGEN
jgi:hypothetical protein